MFTSIYNRPKFLNPILCEICKKSTNEYIRRLTEKNKEDKNKFNVNSNLVSSIVLNSDENNDTPNNIFTILPTFCFISATYFCYIFYKRIKE
uniref:Uncharacterized protein n=1 Tax=viral metagenome TaxID=1070528 RepID=A0A6C0ARE3_9ZZZZ